MEMDANAAVLEIGQYRLQSYTTVGSNCNKTGYADVISELVFAF